MSLTRVTTSVISSNVITSDLLQNNIIQSRHIQPGAITTDLLEQTANSAAIEIRVNANLDIVQDNVAGLVTGLNGANTNINTIQTNVYADFTTLSGFIDLVQDNVASVSANLLTTVGNVNSVQDNVVATQANVTGIISGDTQFSSAKIFQQNVTIQGNLIVVGSQVDLGVGTATIDDNFIVVSANLTGTPATDSGIIVNRGVEGNVFIGDHIEEDGIVFALSQSPHDNATISIQEYLDVHGNAFHATSGLNFSRVHLGHRDDESTGIIADTTNNHIKFIIGGTEVACLLYTSPSPRDVEESRMPSSA